MRVVSFNMVYTGAICDRSLYGDYSLVDSVTTFSPESAISINVLLETGVSIACKIGF